MQYFARGKSGKIRLNNILDLVNLTESEKLSLKIKVGQHEFVSACV